MIPTRSVVQIRTHAQKYFQRLERAARRNVPQSQEDSPVPISAKKAGKVTKRVKKRKVVEKAVLPSMDATPAVVVKKPRRAAQGKKARLNPGALSTSLDPNSLPYLDSSWSPIDDDNQESLVDPVDPSSPSGVRELVFPTPESSINLFGDMHPLGDLSNILDDASRSSPFDFFEHDEPIKVFPSAPSVPALDLMDSWDLSSTDDSLVSFDSLDSPVNSFYCDQLDDDSLQVFGQL